jgi:hypothetical protein
MTNEPRPWGVDKEGRERRMSRHITMDFYIDGDGEVVLINPHPACPNCLNLLDSGSCDECGRVYDKEGNFKKKVHI